MATYGTTYKFAGKTFGGARITGNSFEHAQVRMEFAIAMGWIHEDTELVGELVETIHCPDEIADAMNPVGRI